MRRVRYQGLPRVEASNSNWLSAFTSLPASASFWISDGTLDRKEAKAMPRVAKNFDAIDTDKDGTVSLEEVHTFMKARHKAAKN